MKHEEAKAAAHMAGQDYDIEAIERQLSSIEVAARALLDEITPIPADYEDTLHCRQCGAPVHIRVRHPMSVVLVIQHWYDKMDGKCKACLEASRPQPLYEPCEDVTGTDIDARRVPASVVEGRARHHVFEEMEREGD